MIITKWQSTLAIYQTGINPPRGQASTSVGQHVTVYDSLYDQLTKSTEVQLSQCYGGLINDMGQLAVDNPPVQVQNGSVDCVLFAIAFAYEIASGNRVLKDANFYQMKLRVHLLQCLENEEITAFPRSRKASKLRQRNHELQVIQTFCTCHMPEALIWWHDQIWSVRWMVSSQMRELVFHSSRRWRIALLVMCATLKV